MQLDLSSDPKLPTHSNSNQEAFLSSSLAFNYKMLVQACKFTTLYLLQKYNDLQYLFEDPMQRQYRVRIDSNVQCTCHDGNLGHCIHSLYVLMRLFKLKECDQLLFKTKYDLDDLQYFRGRSKLANSDNLSNSKNNKLKQKESMDKLREEIENKWSTSTNTSTNTNTNIKTETDKLSVSSTFSEQQSKPKQKRLDKEWPVFDADTVCPICYDCIQNSNAIIDCWECHNYFHVKCLKVWITTQYKKQLQSQGQVQVQLSSLSILSQQCSCPMCRNQLQSLIELRMQKMERFYIQYHQSHGVLCAACGNQILIKLYRCLLCEKVQLCGQCYSKWQHKNHDRFICKLGKNQDWSVSQRSQFNINKLNANLEYFKKYGNQPNDVKQEQQFKQLMGEKYNKFMESYIKKPCLLQHIINSLLDVEKEVHKTYKKLEFTQDDIVCCLCKKKKIVGMRRMTCGHFIDEKCLKFILQSSIRTCPIDKKCILPGLKGINITLQ